MSQDDRLDILIFGATGYTGQYVIEEVARKAEIHGLKWGIAGRSTEKLKQFLQQAERETGIDALSSSVEIIVANINDQQSLIQMCKSAKILLDCVGPYRLYGEPVVQACLESRTHYLDLCGEPQFLETIQLQYNDQARDRDIAIIGSCGFDSLVADLGVELIRQECEEENLNIALIESFLSMKFGQVDRGLIHFATWESAVYGFSRVKELKSLRRKLFTEKLDYSKCKLNRKPIFHTNIAGESIWAVPFPGSDKSVVQRSQYFNATQLNKKPIRFQPYLQMSSITSVLTLVTFGLIFSLLTKFQFGIRLLLKYPKFFSAGLVTHEGPTRAQCNRSSFSMTFVTHTEKNAKLNSKIIHRFTGPDPGYLGTSKMLVACAIILLKEKHHLPRRGGVFTPAVAFGKTSIMNYLRNEGFGFIRE